jgi:NlpC/P60 family
MVLPDRPLKVSEEGQPREASRRRILSSLLGMTAAFTPRAAGAQMSPGATSVLNSVSRPGGDYVSPYALNFTIESSLLNAGFDQRPWNDPAAEAAQTVAAWQAAHARPPKGSWPPGAAWGPPARQYPAPVLPRTDPDYMRERVAAVAARHIGLAYQHHHIPSWMPPLGWAWAPVLAGTDGPGLDCSNFTSFVFNYGLGIKLPTDIRLQGATVTLMGPGGAGCLRAERIPLGRYADLETTLAPADLIYIRNRKGVSGHVVMWLGALGRSPDNDPLVIDCSEIPRRDASGTPIPFGVRIRPFRRDGWYWRNATHAHRIIRPEGVACLTPPAAFPEGGDRG